MTDEELVGEVLNGKTRIWRFTAEEPEHPIYIYGHSRFERWIVQLTVQLPAYILLLWMAFIA